MKHQSSPSTYSEFVALGSVRGRDLVDPASKLRQPTPLIPIRTELRFVLCSPPGHDWLSDDSPVQE